MLPFVCQLVAKKSAFYAEGLNDKIEFVKGTERPFLGLNLKRGSIILHEIHERKRFSYMWMCQRHFVPSFLSSTFKMFL